MAISKVDFGGRTLIDLTNDSVTSASLLAGFTAHGADGELIRGAAAPTSSGVESFNGRTGSVVSMRGDYTDDKVLLSSTMHIGGNAQTDVAAALAALLQAVITDYPDLNDLPKINGNTLTGNKTAAQLGITDTKVSVNGTTLTTITASTTDLTDGVSSLTTGQLYLVYE